MKKRNRNKIQFIDFTLLPGKTLFIPAYWWYSVKFNDNNTSISTFKYRTYMNNIAISPYIGLNILQLQNIKRNSFKKVRSEKDNSQKENNIVLQDNKEEKDNIEQPVIENNDTKN